MHWEAHGHCYALPKTIDEDIRAGRTVVANISRTVIEAVRSFYADVTVVLISAPPEVLAQRLAARGRSSDGRVEDRLVRTVVYAKALPDVTISNVGAANVRACSSLRSSEAVTIFDFDQAEFLENKRPPDPAARPRNKAFVIWLS